MARNLHHVPHYQPTPFPSMEQPAEFLPGLGWLQNGHIRRKVKPKYHFIWPKDGKRGSKWGRMKDIVQNKGPDIHVTISADKGDYMHNRQRKPAWSNHLDINMVLPPITLKPAPWTKSSTLGGRSPNLNYDFHQRKYVPPHLVTWADAIWQGPNRNSAWPDAFKGTNGIWYEDVFSPIP